MSTERKKIKWLYNPKASQYKRNMKGHSKGMSFKICIIAKGIIGTKGITIGKGIQKAKITNNLIIEA